MSKHTPGPWSLSPNNDEAVITAVGPFYWFSWSHLPHQPEQYGIDTKADARLISAAPEILEALIAILPMALESHLGGPDTGAIIDQALAAIAKATGATP